jgi:hypothetical protein
MGVSLREPSDDDTLILCPMTEETLAQAKREWRRARRIEKQLRRERHPGE